MKLVFVDCCISQRGTESRTRKLAEAYLRALQAACPEAELETVEVEGLGLRPFDVPALNQRDALAAAKAWESPVFEQARKFREADEVVVAAPFWDLSYPAVLRTYIEHISANGLTYHYEADGCHGDCRAKRLVYLTTGGDVEHEDSVGVIHWRQIAAMFGIPRFEYVFAGGLDLDPAKAGEILDAACELARRLAAESQG